MNSLIKILLTGALILALQGCSWTRQPLVDPDVQVIGFQHLQGGNLLAQRFVLRLQLTNPNDLELEVKGLTFQFNVAGVDLIEGVSNEIPLIKPYSKTEFTVQGSANVIEAVRLIKKISRKPDNPLPYTLQTHIDLAHGWPSSFTLTKKDSIQLNDVLVNIEKR